MTQIEAHIEQTLKRYPASTYFVACSAGVDSTVLLHIVHALQLPVEIVHVNYGLRGDASDADANFLRKLAKTCSLPIHVRTVDLQKQLDEGGNLQELARNVRYTFFSELLSKRRDALVLLAHHQEDQTETFFMNLSRKSGVMGLAAMPEKRGPFVRPMLQLSKEDLVDYARKHGVTWREDATNLTSAYTRNRLRNELLPEIREQLPNIDRSVVILTRHFQEKQQCVHTVAKQVHRQILSDQRLPLEHFQALDEHEKLEVWRQLGQAFGRFETWLDLDHKGTGIVLRKNENCPFDRLVFDGDGYSFLQEKATELPVLRMEQAAALPDTFTKEEVYFDPAKIDGQLQVRKPEMGERIRPIGMKGSRLISDVLSDAKLNALEKQQLVIVCDDTHVLWVPGLSISRKAIATPTSTSIVKVSLSE